MSCQELILEVIFLSGPQIWASNQLCCQEQLFMTGWKVYKPLYHHIWTTIMPCTVVLNNWIDTVRSSAWHEIQKVMLRAHYTDFKMVKSTVWYTSSYSWCHSHTMHTSNWASQTARLFFFCIEGLPANNDWPSDSTTSQKAMCEVTK